VYIEDLLFIGLLKSPVPLCINYKPSKTCSNPLLLPHLTGKVWSSVVREGLFTDKGLSGAASSTLGLNSQRGLRNLFS